MIQMENCVVHKLTGHCFCLHNRKFNKKKIKQKWPLFLSAQQKIQQQKNETKERNCRGFLSTPYGNDLNVNLSICMCSF